MKNLTIILILIFISLSSFAQTKGQFSSSVSWTNFAGTQNRDMTIYVPNDYDASNSYKLVIGFHGLGDTHSNYIGAVSPYCTDSYYGNVIAVSLEYSDWDENLYDDGIVPATIAKIEEDYNLDLANIYLQGFSVGGISSTYRGLENSDIIKGIITNSGAMAGIADIENSCTTGACKNYDYSNTDEVFACFTSSPDYETGYCSGAADPCNAANTFYAVNTATANMFNSYTTGSGLFIDNPNNCHCLPTVTENHQCWDHVSQIVSTTTPLADFTTNNNVIIVGENITYTDNSDPAGATITNWEWTFEGGTPDHYTGQTPPAITYSSTGAYDVSLTVTNSYGDNTKLAQDYVYVGECENLTTSYTMGFEEGENLNLWSIEDVNNDDKTWKGLENSSYTHSGVRTYIYGYHSSNNANDWLYTTCLDLTAGSTYELSLWYRGTGTTYPEKMDIFIGSAQNASAMTQVITDLGVITTNTYLESVNEFTIPSDGEYYIGFHAKSDADMDHIFIDDISLECTSSVGVNTFSKAEINIYPNPAKDNITFTNIENSNIEITDINGRLVLTKQSDTKSVTLNISSLSKGTYVARIINDNKVIVKKIIVQ